MPRLLASVAATLAAAGLLAACSSMPGAAPEPAPAASSSAAAPESGDQAPATTGEMDSEGIVTVGLVEPYSPASEGTSSIAP